MKYICRRTTNAPLMLVYRDSCTWVNESASDFYRRFVNVVYVQNSFPVLIRNDESAFIRMVALENFFTCVRNEMILVDTDQNSLSVFREYIRRNRQAFSMLFNGETRHVIGGEKSIRRLSGIVSQ